jgi:hypothetical protein
VTNYISESAERLGNPKIAATYLDKVASLIEGATVRRDGKSWNWTIEVFGRAPLVTAILARGDDWVDAMKEARHGFVQAATSGKPE